MDGVDFRMMRSQEVALLKCTETLYEAESQTVADRWHLVEKQEDGAWACTCMDYVYRSEFTNCKHVLAVLEVEALEAC